MKYEHICCRQRFHNPNGVQMGCLSQCHRLLSQYRENIVQSVMQSQIYSYLSREREPKIVTANS